MKIAISQLTSEVTVVGARASVGIGPGTPVDLDQVIGEAEGRAVTLADALGPELLVHFTAPASAPDADTTPAPSRPRRASRGDETKE